MSQLRLQADTLILYEDELLRREQHLRESMLHFQQQLIEFAKLQQQQQQPHTTQSYEHNNSNDEEQEDKVASPWENVEISRTFYHTALAPKTSTIHINAVHIPFDTQCTPDVYYIRCSEIISKLVDKYGVHIKRSTKKTGHPIFVLFLYYIFRPKVFYNDTFGQEPRPHFESIQQVNAFCKQHRQQMFDFFEYIFTKGKHTKSKIVAHNEITPPRNIIRRYTEMIIF